MAKGFDWQKAVAHRFFAPAALLVVIGWFLVNWWFVQNQILYIALGILLTFLVPGWAWGLAIVKTDDIIERIVLSAAFSISGIILTLLPLNLVFQLPLTATWLGLPVPVLDAIAITVAGLIYWVVKK